jgi:site-specific DNA recombinase
MERAKDPRAETKPVGIWIRVSTEDQAQGESPQHHEMRGRSYAESRLWEVREVYRLEGVSGKSVMEHPEARRMMADVRRGRIAGLIFSKLARLARNTKELLDFSEFFREHGADLVSLQESIDTSTPHGRLFYTMIAAMAEWEREEIASRVVASIPVRARLGKPMGGIAPLGYRWVDKRLEVNPDEAPLRRLIYELFKEHRRLKTVAEILNAAGHRGQNGRPFRDTTVEKLIVDPTAKGLRRASYTKLVKGQRVLKPETEWIWVPCPSIVSEELWEQCNTLLMKRRVSRKPVAKRAVYAFAGYVYCACGEKMYVRSNTPKYVCNSCHTKIPIVDLDNLFRDELREFTFSPEAIAAWLAQGAEVLAGQEELMGALFRERERLTKEADKLYRLYQEDALSVDGFREKHRPLEERLAALVTEIARLQGEIDFLKIRTVMEEDIIAQTRDLADKWQTMDIPEKRRVVESLLRRITIHKDVVDIDLANLPPLSEMMAKGPPIPADGWEVGEEGRGGEGAGWGPLRTPEAPAPPPAPCPCQGTGTSPGSWRRARGGPGRRPGGWGRRARGRLSRRGVRRPRLRSRR